MPIYKVNVKWQKEKFNDIECDTDQSPDIFKALIFSVSGIPPDRQKVMMPGGTLKDTWNGIRLKNGITIMMMGTSEELPQLTEIDKTKFIEDMTESQITKALKLPQGLKNIGNTCYLNATIQCLRTIPELQKAIRHMVKSTTDIDPQSRFVNDLGKLIYSMENAEAPIAPFQPLKSLHEMCPQFATMTAASPEQGGGQVLMQQDANECWAEVIRSLQKTVQLPVGLNSIGANTDLPESFGSHGGWNFIDQFLTGRFDVTTTNSEDAEDSKLSQESFLQLSCFIDKDVKYIQTGIRNGLETNLTKFSESLNRDTLYKRSSKISRLPAYMSVQFVRFYYKEKERINAKVLKDIKFSIVLDMYEFCTDELKAKMQPMRDRFKAMEDQKAESEKLKTKPSANENRSRKHHRHWFDDDIGSNNSGIYELQAIMTHQGRSSSSGHYVGWVRQSEDLWLKYDDDYVTQVTSEDILRLSGGGDWHCAYVLLYGPKMVEIDDKCDNGDVTNQLMELR